MDDYYTIDSDGDGVPDKKAEYYTYYTDSTQTRKVTIHLASKNNNTSVELDSTGKATNPDGYKRIYIFTNLDTNGYYDGDNDSQFQSDAFSGVFDYVKGEKESRSSVENEVDAVYLKYALGNSYVTNTVSSDGTTMTGDMKVLYMLSEDTRESERLYTVTVKLTPDKESLNTVRLSGAKGAN